VNGIRGGVKPGPPRVLAHLAPRVRVVSSRHQPASAANSHIRSSLDDVAPGNFGRHGACTQRPITLKQLLSDRREDILARFVREVERKELPPPGLPRSVLVDHIPIFLEEIGLELSRGKDARLSMDAVDVSATARQHGEQRWKLGYDLEAIVREYGILRRAILETAKAVGMQPTIDEWDALARYLNVGIAAATTEYVRSSEEQLKARQADLEFLVEAGDLLGSSLDYQSTLGRLTRLLVPRLGDFCVVHIEGCTADEVSVAHVDPAKVELLREALRMFPYPDGMHTHAQVVRTGKSQLREVEPPGSFESIARTPEHLSVLRRLGVRSWMGVPLQIRNNLFGTITVAWSDSDRHYRPSDLLLTEDLARRAAAAIDNARLYDLSREERAIAEAATRSKDEFVAMVSHELRTPLSVIVGWIRLLRSGSLSEQTRNHALEVIERNASAQGQLVSDLLDISRAIAGKVRLEPAQLDLGNLVTLVLEDARVALEAKRLRLLLDVPAESTVIRGDADRLKQVIWNLLLNAIKFTPKDGEIDVSVRRVASELELVVRDTGEGIAPNFLPHVFDAFRQSDSKTTRPHGGLGIGLSIARHLVELHGGSVEARSDGVGKGASFHVRLPISPLVSTTVGVVKMPATAARPGEIVRPPVLVGSSILVVDDEGDVRDLLRFVLESCGMEVHDAGGAREALAKVEARRFDLIVSDIGMPEEDGYFFIRGLRTIADKEKAGIPAIALTAFARGDDRRRALLEGFNAHLAKPVEPAELLLTLADLAQPARTGQSVGRRV
jgi:signal transduction histidine kinase/CheY-like chemotaxis protein